MTDNRIKALLDLMNEMKESAYEHPAPDWETYRERVGRYNGIKDSIQTLIDLERDEED